MAQVTYRVMAPEAAVNDADYSDVADGIIVQTECTTVTLTLENASSLTFTTLPAGTCIAVRSTKVAFTGGTIRAFFLSA